MTVNELITTINLDTNEILDDEAEYIPYINTAIDTLSMILAPMHDPEVTACRDVANNDAIPTNFLQFMPVSGYPITMKSGTFQTYDERTVPDVYYAVKKPHIASMDDAVPFSEMYTFALVQIVSYLVKKKSLMIDFANADNAFIQQLTEAIKGARAR